MTVEVRALSVGEAVPRCNFEGAVHSVFKTAANIQGAGGGLLLTLLAPGETDLPQGIRLEALNGSRFEDLQLGAHVVCRDGMLNLGEALRVELLTASTWECALSSFNADLTDPAVEAAWLQAWYALRAKRAEMQAAMGSGGRSNPNLTQQSAFDRKTDEVMSGVLEATAKLDEAGTESLGRLVGLGPGLTPSGDDVLTGYLAGLWCTVRGKPERGAFLRAAAELVSRDSVRTNDIARTYLCLAAAGQVSSRLVDLAAAICKGDDAKRAWAATAAAMQVGHTSGMESVRGLLLGLAAWDGGFLLASEAR
jgi:hypothetical protein